LAKKPAFGQTCSEEKRAIASKQTNLPNGFCDDITSDATNRQQLDWILTHLSPAN